VPRWSSKNIDAWQVFESVFEARRPRLRGANEYEFFFVVDNHFSSEKLVFLTSHILRVAKNGAFSKPNYFKNFNSIRPFGASKIHGFNLRIFVVWFPRVQAMNIKLTLGFTQECGSLSEH
jgi:hypothetical protein